MIYALGIFFTGILIVIFSSERLVEGVVGTSISFGLSSFLVSVVFIGFDPENLALGSVATYEEAAGIALGSIVGAAMVAIALALGITALIAPMEFREVSRKILLVPVSAAVFLYLLMLDGSLSRLDGLLLLAAFVGAILYLVKLTREGLDVHPGGEVAETLEKKEKIRKWKSVALLVISLAGVIIGSEMIVRSSRTIIGEWGLDETVFGMTAVALLVSIEEVARELPAALKGRVEITFGNVVGSILAFFLFNAGIIALVRPLPVSNEILWFYMPAGILTVCLITTFMMFKRIGRWAGVLLLLIYSLFFAGSYLWG